MDNSRHTLRTAVYLLLIKDGQILLQKRFNTGWEDGKYSLIGGHLDGAESVTQATIREAKEESGIVIKPSDLQVVHIMNRLSNYEYIDFFLVATKWIGEPKLIEVDKADDLGWFSIDDLPENTLPYVRNVVENLNKGLTFSEVGFS